jgi:predicted enzyme related to lactoylglutathione lyase
VGNPVAWFAVYARDGKQAQKFYADLFDWTIDTSFPMGYGIVTPEDGGARGGIGQANDVIPIKGVTFYLQVDDLQVYLEKAERLGGKTTLKPMQISGGPTIAVFTDLDGNAIGLMSRDPRFVDMPGSGRA